MPSAESLQVTTTPGPRGWRTQGSRRSSHHDGVTGHGEGKVEAARWRRTSLTGVWHFKFVHITIGDESKLDTHHKGLGRYHFFFTGLFPLAFKRGTLSPLTDCAPFDGSDELVGSASDVIPIAPAVV